MFPFETVIFGTHYDNDDGTSRSEIITRCRPGERLLLKREPRNQYDRNAVAVFRANGEQLGYLSKRDAPGIAAVMDRGVALHAHIAAIGDEDDEDDEEIAQSWQRGRTVVTYSEDAIPEVHIVISDRSIAQPPPPPKPAQADPFVHYLCRCGQTLAIPVMYVGQSGTCNHCGTRFTVPRPAVRAQLRQGKKKKWSFGKVVGWVLLVGYIFVVLNMFFVQMPRDRARRAAAEKARIEQEAIDAAKKAEEEKVKQAKKLEQQRKKEERAKMVAAFGEDWQAIGAAKRLVRDALPTPATADFPWLITDATVQPNGVWTVRSYVDFQNVFGATIRKNWQATLQWDPTSKTMKPLAVKLF